MQRAVDTFGELNSVKLPVSTVSVQALGDGRGGIRDAPSLWDRNYDSIQNTVFHAVEKQLPLSAGGRHSLHEIPSHQLQKISPHRTSADCSRHAVDSNRYNYHQSELPESKSATESLARSIHPSNAYTNSPAEEPILYTVDINSNSKICFDMSTSLEVGSSARCHDKEFQLEFTYTPDVSNQTELTGLPPDTYGNSSRAADGRPTDGLTPPEAYDNLHCEFYVDCAVDSGKHVETSMESVTHEEQTLTDDEYDPDKPRITKNYIDIILGNRSTIECSPTSKTFTFPRRSRRKGNPLYDKYVDCMFSKPQNKPSSSMLAKYFEERKELSSHYPISNLNAEPCRKQSNDLLAPNQCNKLDHGLMDSKEEGLQSNVRKSSGDRVPMYDCTHYNALEECRNDGLIDIRNRSADAARLRPSHSAHATVDSMYRGSLAPSGYDSSDSLDSEEHILQVEMTDVPDLPTARGHCANRASVKYDHLLDGVSGRAGQEWSRTNADPTLPANMDADCYQQTERSAIMDEIRWLEYQLQLVSG